MEWINIKDKLPEKNTQVLIFDNYYLDISVVDYCKEDFRQKGFWINENSGEHCTDVDVTYWQPLPDAPK